MNPRALFALPLALCFACGSSVDQPLRVEDDGEWIALDSIDAGDGRSVGEFVQEELSFTVDVDWSFVNLAELPADTVTVVPGEVASEGLCEVDGSGSPSRCQVAVVVTVSSTSGLYDVTNDYDVAWTPNAIAFAFNDQPELDAQETDQLAAGLEDDGIAFGGSGLVVTLGRGGGGSSAGWPPEGPWNVLTISGMDDNTGRGVLFAADDTAEQD